MNRVVLRGELRLLIRDPAVQVALFVLLAALAAAVAQGLLRHDRLLTDLAERLYEDAARLEAVKWQAIRLKEQGGEISPFRDPRNADVVGRRLGVQHPMLPPTALGSLSVGQSDLHAAWQLVSLDPPDRLLAEGEFAHPRQLAIGRFDVSFVVVYLAPLLLLGLLAVNPAREREEGMLPMLALQSGRLDAWLGLRSALRFGLVAVPILLAGAGVVLWHGESGYEAVGEDPAAAQTGLRYLLWALQVVVYLTFWTTLGAWVGTLPLDTVRTALALAGAWLMVVVLLPAVANVSLELRHPQPSRIEYVDAMRAATDAARAEGSAVLAQYLEDHPEMAGEDVDFDDFFAQRLLVQERVQDALQPLSERFEQQRQARSRQVAALRLLSPAMLAMDGLADAAGTGEARQQDFQRQVQAQHETWREFFMPRVLTGEAFLDHDAIPGFERTEESASSLLARAAIPLLLPTLLATFFTTLALRRSRRLHKVVAGR